MILTSRSGVEGGVSLCRDAWPAPDAQHARLPPRTAATGGTPYIHHLAHLTLPSNTTKEPNTNDSQLISISFVTYLNQLQSCVLGRKAILEAGWGGKVGTTPSTGIRHSQAWSEENTT